MSRFQFFADVNDNGTLELSERLVDQSINIDYNAGQPGDIDGADNEIEFAFTFPATTAHRWRVVATQGTSVGPFEGIRIQEVDAVAAPTATTLTADPPVQGLLTLRARLTDAASGAPIPGQTIVMATSGGTVCQALTDAGGFASCSGLAAVLQIALESGYTASFSGTELLLPSSARAGLLAGGSGTSPPPSVVTVPPPLPSVGPPVSTTPPAVGTLASTGDLGGIEAWGLVLLLAGLVGVACLSTVRRVR